MVYGPVPSRRLGRSLGINHISPKICTYACVYCQLGNTLKMQTGREKFYAPEEILVQVEKALEQAKMRNDTVDYLAFVPDGEPTLDMNLGKTIRLLQPWHIPVAVITNGTLLDDPAVQDELLAADWVSLKVDTVNPALWQRIDRPYGKLSLEAILNGMRQFRDKFKGKLVTETMLIHHLNDSREHMEETAQFLSTIQPDIAYIAIPTRPPAEQEVLPATSEALNRAWNIFSAHLNRVELLTGYEGNAFSFTGNARDDIFSITSVHPMRREAVEELLSKSGQDWYIVEDLLHTKALVEEKYDGHIYYLRNLKTNQ